MQRSLPEKLPEYRTVEPRLYPSTSCIAALDGTDQQIFSFRGQYERGIAAWGVLYAECDPRNPDPESIHYDGPKVRLLRQKYKEIFAQSNNILNRLIDFSPDITPHKLHNIY